MEENKTFSLTLSNQMIIRLALIALPIIGGGAYYTITLYNQMLSVIDSYDESRIEALEHQMKTQQERYLELMTNNVKLQDKASDAYVLGKEASATAKASQREVEASLNAMRNEVKAELESVKDKMKALQKATTNPLGR